MAKENAENRKPQTLGEAVTGNTRLRGTDWNQLARFADVFAGMVRDSIPETVIWDQSDVEPPAPPFNIEKPVLHVSKVNKYALGRLGEEDPRNNPEKLSNLKVVKGIGYINVQRSDVNQN